MATNVNHDDVITAAQMASLVKLDEWACFRDRINTRINEDIETMLKGQEPPDFVRGRILALRFAINLPYEWVEWRKHNG